MIAYYNITAFITLYIVEIVYDIEDYAVFFVSNNDTGERSKSIKSRIRYTRKGVPYFIHNRSRIYLDECITVKR